MIYTFNITYKDLWIEEGNYKYFLMVAKNRYNDLWLFGKPF